MMNGTVSENTKAILLLTAPLVAEGSSTPSADYLTPSEYKRLARHLLERQLQPADLLTPDRSGLVRDIGAIFGNGRLEQLINRGLLLSQAIDRWQARAIWVLSRADAEYPSRLKARLKENAPAVIYGCGEVSLLEGGGLGVVGSRNIDDGLIGYTLALGELAANARKTVISGGARGIDRAAMRGALDAGGCAVGILADGLEKSVMNRENRDLLIGGKLVLACPYDPSAGFNVGNAMQRNKLIYALSDATLVVNADLGSGGTWAGAVEQLEKLHLVPVYVRSFGESSPALDALEAKGAIPWPNPGDADEFSAVFVSTGKHILPVQDTLPSEELLPLERAAHNPGATIQDEEQDASSSPSLADALFQVVSDLMLKMLQTPLSEAEIAEALDVTRPQCKAWLDRLTREHKVDKLKRPVRYRLSKQSYLLIDEEGSK